MFRRPLVPLDGSPESEDILPEAIRLAGAASELFLLHVCPVLPPPVVTVPEALSIPQAAFAYLERTAGRLRHRKVRLVVRQGDPAEEITQAALELGVDLLAMSTHGRGGLRRILLGSVAEEVVVRLALPVLLARPGCPRPGFELRDILVPLDGTARSAKILDDVLPLAVEHHALVRLMHVIVPVTVAVPPAGVYTMAPAELADPRPELERLARPLKEAGLKVKTHVTSGFAAAEILRMAREAGSDLIAMATSGKKGMERFLLGSVAEEVLQTTDRPVLLRRMD
ncbi:MAG TPA: universal stress protein [Planctomycetota bacterium]